MNYKISLQAEVPESMSGGRIDQVAAQIFPDYSRAKLQSWIKHGSLVVNGKPIRARDKAHGGDIVTVEAQLKVEDRWSAGPVLLDIVYEDDSLIVINKPVNTVVHPAAGHREGTLLNGLLNHCKQLESLPRAGIVHRLDKDTTGLLVVAKTLQAHTSLVKQLQQRSMSREYEAVVNGVVTAGGTMDFPLGRHPVNRKKRAVTENGKRAITHFTVIKRYASHTHVKVRLETGRTHQIRVHFNQIEYPIVGDKLYGGRLRLPRGATESLATALREFSRQALHAKTLGLVHPCTDEPMTWTSELPGDMRALLAILEKDRKYRS